MIHICNHNNYNGAASHVSILALPVLLMVSVLKRKLSRHCFKILLNVCLFVVVVVEFFSFFKNYLSNRSNGIGSVNLNNHLKTIHQNKKRNFKITPH